MTMDIGVLLLAAVSFFFVLAACLAILMVALKAKETSDTVLAEVRQLRKQIDRLTSGAD